MTPPNESPAVKPEPSYAPVYAAALYPELSKIARKHGYALAVHGSLQRDFDLIAVPWIDCPSEPDALIDEFLSTFDIRKVGGPPSDKPHGRRAWTLAIGHGTCAIDLSFMPFSAPAASDSRGSGTFGGGAGGGYDPNRIELVLRNDGTIVPARGSGVVDEWPEYVMLRDCKIHDDLGGLGQRIFTTAGAGYEKRKYVRADLAAPAPPAVASGEPVIIPEAVRYAVERMSCRLDPSVLKGVTADEDSRCMLIIANFISQIAEGKK